MLNTVRRVLGDGGINWNWYLCADFNDVDKTCHIFYYDRWHKFEDRGSNHPANAEWNVGFSILQTDKRVIYGIRYRGEDYLVTNPKHIFAYDDKSVYVPEK